MKYPVDTLVLVPDDVDIARSPLAGQLGEETYILGAFNPGMTRLPTGNLLLMVRIAKPCGRRSATAMSVRSAGPMMTVLDILCSTHGPSIRPISYAPLPAAVVASEGESGPVAFDGLLESNWHRCPRIGLPDNCVTLRSAPSATARL